MLSGGKSTPQTAFLIYLVGEKAHHTYYNHTLMPSLALIFHLIDMASGRKPVGVVSEQTAKLSDQWCGYLDSHARRIYAMTESPEHET